MPDRKTKQQKHKAQRREAAEQAEQDGLQQQGRDPNQQRVFGHLQVHKTDWLSAVGFTLNLAAGAMSVKGYTPNPSPAGSSSSPATSSSHQPPTKTLRAMDGTESEETPVKVLEESTDSDLVDDVIHAVPNVPEEIVSEKVEDATWTSPVGLPRQPTIEVPYAKEETPEEQYHDADDFVPRQDRAATLDHGVETFVIGDDKEDEIKQEEREGQRAGPE